MSVLGTGPKCSSGHLSGAVSVWPGGMRDGSTPSGRRLLLKRNDMLASIGITPEPTVVPRQMALGGPAILAIPSPCAKWARSSVGRARESHSRGQGFESPRVHQISSRDSAKRVIFLVGRARFARTLG